MTTTYVPIPDPSGVNEVEVPAGTDPKTNPADRTLKFISSDSSVTMVGNASTLEIDFSSTGGTGSVKSFVTISTPSGTSPVASGPADTLTFTSTGGTMAITGNSATDTINLEAIISYNLDGGNPASIYGGTTPINGGVP